MGYVGNKFSFDVMDLIEICKKKINKLNRYYLRSIELGSEFSKNTEAEAKVYEINFNMRLK